MRSYKNNKKLSLWPIMGLAISLSTSPAFSHGGEEPTPKSSKNTYYFDAESGMLNLPKVIVGDKTYSAELKQKPGVLEFTVDNAVLISQCRLLVAARLFDGIQLHTDKALLIEGNIVKQVGTQAELAAQCDNVTDLGDATILPGFIESHAHITFQNVDAETVLKHGITTVRDVGGPSLAATGGHGSLRLLSSGPIIQAPNGYPTNLFGGDASHQAHDPEASTEGSHAPAAGAHGAMTVIGASVETVEQARETVRHFVEAGAVVIKIALEPGGEHGAPWSSNSHGHGGPALPWPMLPLEVVQAIVDEAHDLGVTVTAHVGENEGVTLALDAGVDEWSHVPCAAIDESLLQRAADQGVKVVTTIDTLSNCMGIAANTTSLAAKGVTFIYGSEIGHNDVPWGINAEELHSILHLTGTSPLEIFQSATSKAGETLGIEHLGTLVQNAPADIIAVKGNPFEKFKPLEYPDLVISGGKTVVDNFSAQ